MSSNSTPRRSTKQPTSSTASQVLPQQQYYSPHISLGQNPYPFQHSQPFPSFSQSPQMHQPHIQQPQQMHHHSPYGQPPPQSQHLQHPQQIRQPQQLVPHIPSQNPTASPPSRKRKTPGGLPPPDMSSMPPPLGSETSTAGVQQPDVAPDEAQAPPIPKKNRTNTPWSPAEEQRLRVMREAGKSWGEIAKSFPSRTEGSVKKHWYKDMHYADFAEDEALLNAIKEYEANKWKEIGRRVGKPAKACEQYAKEHFGGKI